MKQSQDTPRLGAGRNASLLSFQRNSGAAKRQTVGRNAPRLAAWDSSTVRNFFTYYLVRGIGYTFGLKEGAHQGGVGVHIA